MCLQEFSVFYGFSGYCTLFNYLSRKILFITFTLTNIFYLQKCSRRSFIVKEEKKVNMTKNKKQICRSTFCLHSNNIFFHTFGKKKFSLNSWNVQFIMFFLKFYNFFYNSFWMLKAKISTYQCKEKIGEKTKVSRCYKKKIIYFDFFRNTLGTLTRFILQGMKEIKLQTMREW